MSDPKNPTADGQIADPQGSNFGVKIEDTRNYKSQPDSHSSIQHGKGVIASAVASHGGRLASAPDEKSIVTVGGMTMPISSALREGFLVKNDDGSFSDGPAITGGAPSEQEGSGLQLPEADETNSLQVDAELADSIVDLTEGLESIGGNPVALFAEVFKDPDVLPAQVLNLARERGLDEGAVANHFDEIKMGVALAIDDFVVENGGIEAEELEAFWTFTRANVADTEIVRAATSLVFTKEPKPLLELAAAYLRRSR